MTPTAVALAGVERLAVDTAPFIYLVEQHPIYAPVVREIFRRIDGGQILGFTSAVTLTELLVLPLQKGDNSLAQTYRDILLQSARFAVRNVDATVAEEAARLRSKYRVRTPDAIQLATAICLECDAFLTNDAALQQVTELPVLLVSELAP